MNRNWKRYEGQFLGGWRLESFLGERDGSKAFFMAHNGIGPKSVLMEVMAAGEPASDAALASWSLAKRFAHEHLLRVRAAAEEEMESGERLVYGALDLPDDDLSEMTPRRPLEQGEVRAMLSAAAHALEYLHDQGMSHGAVLPANIFWMDDGWKLSVDTLAPANAESRTRDIRQLGGTLVWVLRGGGDAPTQTPSAESIAGLDAAFREIAKGCLNEGWTATQLVAALEGRSVPPKAEERITPVPAAKAPPKQRVKVAPTPLRQARSNTWPVVTALVAVLVLILVYVLNGRGRPEAAASSVAQLPPPKAEMAKAERPIPRHTEPAGAAATNHPGEHGSADRDIPSHSSSRTQWAVIAATYDRRPDAEKRAGLIRAKWRQFHPQVFPPDGQAGQYYVVLGSGLSRDAADALRRRARSAGVAGDSYTTRLATRE